MTKIDWALDTFGEGITETEILEAAHEEGVLVTRVSPLVTVSGTTEAMNRFFRHFPALDED